MKRNHLISIFVSSSLLFSNLFGTATPLIPSSTTVFTSPPSGTTTTVTGASTTAPAQDGTKFFNQSTVDTSVNQINVTTSSKTLVGNDTLPQSNIDTGLHYTNNFGDQSTGASITNTEGNSVYIERNTDGTIPTFTGADQTVTTDYSQRTKDSNYVTWQQNYESYVMEPDKDTKRTKENDTNKASMTMNYKLNNNFNEMSNRFFNGNSVFSGGQNLTTTFRQKTYRDDAPQELKDREDAGTKLYSEHYSSTVNEADKEKLVTNTTYGALNKAYSGLSAITEELTNRINGSKIKCQISRELVPSYRCPLPGKDGLQYPGSPDMADIRKVNIEEAKKDCNDDCWTDPGTLSCVGQKVINSKDINLNIPSDGIVLTPWSETTAEINVTLTALMPVNSLTVNVELLKPSGSTMTDAEWLQFVQDSGFKFRYSVLEVDTNIPDLPPVTIIDREQFQIRSTTSELTIPINRAMNGLRIKFWKPYITTNILEAYKYEPLFTKLTTEGAVIKVKKAKAEYSSDSYYFCQAMQMVANPSECLGGDIAEFVTGDDQYNYICNADSKKIGPEPTWGAFYSEDSCKFACVMHKECQPTYRHYSSYGTETVLYKAKIGCVDDPETNRSCSPELCETLFGDNTQRPVNEMVVANDDTFIYTIRNKVLQDYPRPKIDLAAELATSVDYAAVFENEEKDSAYMYMINNITYNRIMYRVGTESPFNMAYHKESNGMSGNVFSVDLKPNSFDYDSGNTFYVYSVVKVVEAYAPVAGTWYLNDHDITASQTYIQWRDYTYLVKTGLNQGEWKTFRKEEFSEYLVNNDAYVLYEDGTVGQYQTIDWIKTPQYQIKKFATYNEVDNTFINFDRNSEAPYFTTTKYESSQDFYRYNITNNSTVDFFETKGSVIRDQRSINHDTSFEKIYNQPSTYVYKGNPQDMNIYLVYSKTKLTYDQLMKEIEGSCAVAAGPCYDDLRYKELPENNKWGAYNLLNSRLFRSDLIKYDGELNNNIKTLIMGTKDKQTVSVDWEPSLSEKGKKVFKFIFLYDDNTPTTWQYINEVADAPNPIQAPTSAPVVTPNVAPAP